LHSFFLSILCHLVLSCDMIEYESGGLQLSFIWRLRGSVLPRAFLFGACAGLISALLKLDFVKEHQLTQEFGYKHSDDADFESFGFKLTMYTSFSSVVGFLLVFRTVQAMNRFISGLDFVTCMGAQYYEACSSLIAFATTSKRPCEQVRQFQNLTVLLFSMLNASTMQTVAGSRVLQLPVLDTAELDAESAALLENMCKNNQLQRTNVIQQWIEHLVVKNMGLGVLDHIPPPVLTRVFQQLANGYVEYSRALAIAHVPFPFPYAQITSVLLILQMLMTPFFISVMTNHWLLAFCYAFVPVGTLWAINLTAAEIQEPFHHQDNDLPMNQIVVRNNDKILLLVHPDLRRLPVLREPNKDSNAVGKCMSLSDMPTEVSPHDAVFAIPSSSDSRTAASLLLTDATESDAPYREPTLAEQVTEADRVSRNSLILGSLSGSSNSCTWQRNLQNPPSSIQARQRVSASDDDYNGYGHYTPEPGEAARSNMEIVDDDLPMVSKLSTGTSVPALLSSGPPLPGGTPGLPSSAGLPPGEACGGTVRWSKAGPLPKHSV